MGKHYMYNLRKIPQMDSQRYHYFLGLRDGEDQLLNIVDKCTTSDQMETVFRYLEARLKIADYYVNSWGDEVRKCIDAKEHGDLYDDAKEIKDRWSVEHHQLSQVLNFMIEVCGVDRYGRWILEEGEHNND